VSLPYSPPLAGWFFSTPTPHSQGCSVSNACNERVIIKLCWSKHSLIQRSSRSTGSGRATWKRGKTEMTSDARTCPTSGSRTGTRRCRPSCRCWSRPWRRTTPSRPAMSAVSRSRCACLQAAFFASLASQCSYRRVEYSSSVHPFNFLLVCFFCAALRINSTFFLCNNVSRPATTSFSRSAISKTELLRSLFAFAGVLSSRDSDDTVFVLRRCYRTQVSAVLFLLIYQNVLLVLQWRLLV